MTSRGRASKKPKDRFEFIEDFESEEELDNRKGSTAQPDIEGEENDEADEVEEDGDYDSEFEVGNHGSDDENACLNYDIVKKNISKLDQ